MDPPLEQPLLEDDAAPPPDDGRATMLAQSRRNVRVILLWSFVTNLSRGIWQGQLLTVFLFKEISGSMTEIGIIEGVQGVARLVSAIAAGVVADRLRHRRNLLLRGGAVFGVAVHAACALLVLAPRPPRAAGGALGAWCAGLSLYAALVSLQTVGRALLSPTRRLRR